MSYVGYQAQNHPQQADSRGALDAIDDRATPPEVFGPLHERFGFTLDVSAMSLRRSFGATRRASDAYHCRFCGSWHVGHRPRRRR